MKVPETVNTSFAASTIDKRPQSLLQREVKNFGTPCPARCNPVYVMLVASMLAIDRASYRTDGLSHLGHRIIATEPRIGHDYVSAAATQ